MMSSQSLLHIKVACKLDSSTSQETTTHAPRRCVGSCGTLLTLSLSMLEPTACID